MKRDAGVIPFSLSRAELHWLAGAFGIASLPLPEDIPAGLSSSQLESLQKDGHASLLTRSLIRPSPGFGWQVERLPAALVQWIASSPSLLKLEHTPKEEKSRRAYIFSFGDQGLLLEMDGDTAHFIIFESVPHLQDAILRWLSLPTGSKSSASHTLPQPLTFLPTVWKDPQLAMRILDERGTNPKAIKSVLAWVSKLEWGASLSHVKLEARGNSLLNQYVLCGDGKSAWGGNGKDKNTFFVPVSTTEISAEIAKMLCRFVRLT